MPERIDARLIAPCGVCCIACGAHLDRRRPCPGCRAPQAEQIRKSCQSCAKKQCAAARGVTWCHECGRFPCARIKSLNARYVAHYGIDLVRDGGDAREDMQAHLAALRARCTCAWCGGVVDQHRGICSECGAAGGQA